MTSLKEADAQTRADLLRHDLKELCMAWGRAAFRQASVGVRLRAIHPIAENVPRAVFELLVAAEDRSIAPAGHSTGRRGLLRIEGVSCTLIEEVK